jgi:hypothetical protein
MVLAKMAIVAAAALAFAPSMQLPVLNERLRMAQGA